MLPTRIDRPSTWIGEELRSRQSDWVFALSAAEVDELERAAACFQELGRDVGEISRETFPLGSFADHLSQLRDTLLHGIGFEVIRGLPVERYSQAFAATIFCGIGAHLGRARSQNAAGHILGHVRNVGADAADVNTRIYQTAERQTFHTDSTDVVGLLCLRKARQGGESLLVSAEAIYNRMREESPDLLDCLFEPIATDRRGETPDGCNPWFTIPVFSWHEDRLTVMYQRQYIDSAQRFAEAPRLTETMIKALDRFDRIANETSMHLRMQLEPGDMQFVYNHAMLHDRTAFDDYDDPEERRHLLRLWLSMAGDRELPPCFAERYGSIEIGNRGGIVTAETRLHAPIDA